MTEDETEVGNEVGIDPVELPDLARAVRCGHRARGMVAAALLSVPGFVDLGDGWEIRQRRAERERQQSERQREAALDRAEAKRARKLARRRAEASRLDRHAIPSAPRR